MARVLQTSLKLLLSFYLVAWNNCLLMPTLFPTMLIFLTYVIRFMHGKNYETYVATQVIKLQWFLTIYIVYNLCILKCNLKIYILELHK